MQCGRFFVLKLLESYSVLHHFNHLVKDFRRGARRERIVRRILCRRATVSASSMASPLHLPPQGALNEALGEPAKASVTNDKADSISSEDHFLSVSRVRCGCAPADEKQVC